MSPVHPLPNSSGVLITKALYSAMQFDNPKDLSVAILAGGKSSRFGEPKLNAYFGDQRLIDYSKAIGELISPDVFVVKHPQQKIDQADATVLTDMIPGCGPAGGIHAALEQVQTPWLAVLPCDMPFLIPEIYEILFQNREANRPVVAISENGMESLVSLWPKSLANSVKKYLMQKELAVNRILDRLNAVKVPIPEIFPEYQPEFFFNINYKKDLQEMEKLAGLLKSNFLKNIGDIFEQLS